MIENLVMGLEVIFQWHNIMAMVLGIILGVIIGAIPGLGPAMAIALLIPITFKFNIVTALTFLLAIFISGIYGGSIASILINTPGTPAAAATALEGYPLAQQGKARKALKMALYASVVGDMFSILILIFISQFVANIALKFGPPETFGLLVFSLTVISAVSGKRLSRGLISAVMGFLLATVGMDPITADTRFGFGSIELEGGLHILPMIIGMFAVSEIFVQSGKKGVEPPVPKETFIKKGDPKFQRVSFSEFMHCMPTMLRSSAIGSFLGALPGIGADIAAFVSYGFAKKRSKHPELYGKGSLEGISATESGNNAVCAAALIPLLTLGIPGDLVAAMFFGALILHGVTPGPMIFMESGDVVYSLFVGLFVANIFLLLIGFVIIKFAVHIVKASRSFIYPIVFMLAIMGAYATDSRLFDVWATLAFGCLGYIMRKVELPLPPMVIAFLLAPMLEIALRQSLILSDGNPTIFIARPIAAGFLILAVIAALSIVYGLMKTVRAKEVGTSE